MAKATKNSRSEVQVTIGVRPKARRQQEHDQAAIDRSLTKQEVLRALGTVTDGVRQRLEKEEQSVPVGLGGLDTEDLWDIARQRNEKEEMTCEARIAFRELAERGELPNVDAVQLSEFISAWYGDGDGDGDEPMTYEARIAFQTLADCGVLDMLDDEELREITRQRDVNYRMTQEAQAAFYELSRRSIEGV